MQRGGASKLMNMTDNLKNRHRLPTARNGVHKPKPGPPRRHSRGLRSTHQPQRGRVRRQSYRHRSVGLPLQETNIYLGRARLGANHRQLAPHGLPPSRRAHFLIEELPFSDWRTKANKGGPPTPSSRPRGSFVADTKEKNKIN